jgi:hypothetical protein
MKLLMDEKDINLPFPGEEILAKHIYLLVFSGGIQHSHMNEKLQLYKNSCVFVGMHMESIAHLHE